MSFYLDIVWLLNLLFNSLLLYITGVILKRNISKKRVFLAGLLGSLIIFAPFISFGQILLAPFTKIFISLLMVWIAFGFRKLRFFLSNLFVFYLCTFSTGGALIGLHYLLSFDFNLKSSLLLASTKGFGDPISWIFVLVGFPVMLYFSRNTFDKFETTKIQLDQIVEVKISINQEICSLNGLIDSGNNLYDPLSKRPVMICEVQKVTHLFPGELLDVFENPHSLMNLKDELEEWTKRLSIIPYKVIGHDHRLMTAMKPDFIQICKGEEVYETKQVLIAFVNQRLSGEGLFDCILHPKMVNSAISKNVS